MSVLLVLLNKVRKEKILTCCFLWSFSLMLLLPLLKNLWDSHGLSAWSSQTSFTRQQTRKFFTWTLFYGQNHIQQGELFEYMPQPHDYHWHCFWPCETQSNSVLRVTLFRKLDFTPVWRLVSLKRKNDWVVDGNHLTGLTFWCCLTLKISVRVLRRWRWTRTSTYWKRPTRKIALNYVH